MRIGIDIGGTKVNMGFISDSGEILLKRKVSTLDSENPEALAVRIAEVKREMAGEAGFSEADITFIGAGVPGTADTRTGMVSYCPNLQWYDVPMGEYLSKAMGKPVLVAQDSRNGALAEKLFGAGKPFDNLMVVTIGTGIGCGIVLDGRVFSGGMNTAGELGHITIDRKGEQCACGSIGCLERYTSGNNIFRRAYQAFPERFENWPKKCESVFDLAASGDTVMQKVIEECLEDLAAGIAGAVNLLSVEAVIISGGLSEHDMVIEFLRKRIPARGYYAWTHLNRLQVLKAVLGSDAPMIGAAFIGTDCSRS